MYLGEPSTKNRRLIIGGIIATLVLLYLIAFGREWVDAIRMMITWFYGDGPFPARPVSIILYGLLTFMVLAGVWILFISQQALLPAVTPQERLRTAYQFLLYILGQHGPAVFVKDGKVLSTKEDVRDGPGVAVVDFNSAIVLEERLPPPGLSSGFDNFFHRLGWMLGLADKAESPRVMGPGIVFTRPRERIRGAVDLRRQFRMVKGVEGYTRDGIEVTSNVWSIFTIGQDPEPDALEVTYAGEKRPENLRVTRFEELPDGHLRLVSLSDELDEVDRQEIHHFYHVATRTHAMQPYSPLPPRVTLPVFNKERVFAAVYSEARGDDEKAVPWTDLPTRLAAVIFREIISKVNYDQFYQAGTLLPFPMEQFKSRLKQTMRNSGLLSYRLIMVKKNEPFQLRRVYSRDDLEVSEIKALTNSKILRDRGIRVIASGFGDILPKNQAVYRHRIESWRAPWERDQVITSAGSELEAMRIKARARALAQRDLVNSLNTIIQTTNHPEVLGVRLLQALEKVASDPDTRKLLPGNTIEMMKHTHDLLLATDDGHTPNPSLPNPQGEQHK